jgi:hypothetical protein
MLTFALSGNTTGEIAAMIAGLGRAALIVATLLFAGATQAADEVKAISTGGMGDLTMCPVTFPMYRSCNLYHHIKLPPQIALGDTVRLRYGSNPKRYQFPVVRIVHDGDTCTVFSQATETEKVEKIEVAFCQVSPGAQ